MPDTVNLFNRVAKHYDALNTFFSLGMDRQWRKRLAEEIKGSRSVLDLATGTGEVAIETVHKLQKAQVVGIDPSAEMLALARQKIESGGYSERIMLAQCEAENLPFKDNVFDAVTIAFGIRNTVDPKKSLLQMKRVLKNGGKAGIMEFAVPGNKLFAPLYLFYFKKILPVVGSIFGTGKEYKYLSDSTESFPQREDFVDLIKEAGLEPEKSIELMMGIVIIYIGVNKD